jgi:hypothetical protein
MKAAFALLVLVVVGMALAQPKERDSLVDQVQREADRGTGYVEPEANYELDRIYENRERNRTTREELELLERDRERRQQLDARNRNANAISISTDPEFDNRRRYFAGVMAENPELNALRQALRNWAAQRDSALASASGEAEQQQVRKAFDLRLTEILVVHMARSAPTTAPVTQPAE